MNLSDPGEREWWGRHVAAHAAEGCDTEHIWIALDITREEVEEIYELAEFKEALGEHGLDIREAWELTQADTTAKNTIKQRINDRAERYFKELDDIALDKGEKSEIRTRIMLQFLESNNHLSPTGAGQMVSLTPAAIKLLNKGAEILDRQPRKLTVVESVHPHEP